MVVPSITLNISTSGMCSINSMSCITVTWRYLFLLNSTANPTRDVMTWSDLLDSTANPTRDVMAWCVLRLSSGNKLYVMYYCDVEIFIPIKFNCQSNT
jgi:hypothetical protein